jgi:hypothetical protein
MINKFKKNHVFLLFTFILFILFTSQFAATCNCIRRCCERVQESFFRSSIFDLLLLLFEKVGCMLTESRPEVGRSFFF